MGLSVEAKALWVDCFLWIGEQETDGHIPQSIAQLLATSTEAIDSLVTCGLWEREGNGFYFHDYREWNPEVDRRREQTRQRVQRYRALRNAPREDKKRINPPTPQRGDVAAVFGAWQAATGRQKAKCDAKRRDAIVRARKKLGFTVDQLVLAMAGITNDPWADRKRHNDITIILRDAAHVEKFIDLAENPPPRAPGERVPPPENWKPPKVEGTPVTLDQFREIRRGVTESKISDVLQVVAS